MLIIIILTFCFGQLYIFSKNISENIWSISKTLLALQTHLLANR